MKTPFTAGLRPVFLSLLVLLLTASGCDNKGDSAPLSPGPGGGNDLDPEMAQDQALSAIQVTSGLASGIDQLAHGDFSGLAGDLGISGAALRGGEEVVWDETLQAWVLDVEVTEVDGTASATIDVYFWIKFLDQLGQPQQEPNETTATMAMSMDMAMDLHGEEDGSVFDLEMEVDMAMEVAGLPEGPYIVDAQGSMAGSILWTGIGEEDLDVDFTMSWEMDMLVPSDGGCPTGNMLVSIDPYTVEATYDGDTTYEWQLYEDAQLIESGSDFAPCSSSASSVRWTHAVRSPR